MRSAVETYKCDGCDVAGLIVGRPCPNCDDRTFTQRVVLLVGACAEPWGTDPDGEAGPLTPKPAPAELVQGGRDYAHQQLRPRGWTSADIDELVDAIHTLEAERLATTIQAMQAYREVYAAAGRVGPDVWEQARAADAAVRDVLQDLLDVADQRVAAAMESGLAAARVAA